MKKTIVVIVIIVLFIPVSAQLGQREFFNTSLSVNKTGMYILGGWAIANMAVGATGWIKTNGSAMYFHQMNFFWNTVNLGIAGFSFYAANKIDPLHMSPQQMMDQHMLYEKLFLINAGLDVLYVGTGFLLRSLSARSTKRPDMLMGYGNSVILQGGFLFIFDAVMYFIQRGHRLEYLGNFRVMLQPDGALLQLTHHF